MVKGALTARALFLSLLAPPLSVGLSRVSLVEVLYEPYNTVNRPDGLVLHLSCEPDTTSVPGRRRGDQ